MNAIKSIAIWICEVMLVLIWLPMLAVRRLFDRDPALYNTGRFFRKLGKAASKVNPRWNVHIEGYEGIDDRHPYVMVCNHLSQADIPVISNLPWEMKWTAKKSLFDIPVLGWMLKIAGDIPIERSRSQSIGAFRQASRYLRKNCSVMFFPEGTRSRTGKLNRFARGAFELAIREQVPILPMAIDGTQGCLPKKSWKFGPRNDINLKILDPISTEGLSTDQVNELTEKVRSVILTQLSEWRNKPVSQIDGMLKRKK
ncbi:MAG TPA: lysophospholipid acyltransferase family protein [Balneolaceae bacterium]|nr:lysophospholipid acyltransferase family protein [Balneolaceae bacterium]